MGKQLTWHGEPNRPLMLCRPCPCGCDERDGRRGVGHITASDSTGKGATIWIEDEEVFQVFAQCAGAVLLR